MRVILDVNILISFLLSSRTRQSTITNVMDAAFNGRFVLVLPEGLLNELIEAVATKRKLSRLIQLSEAYDLIAALRAIGVALPAAHHPQQRIGRDPKDDYILVAAYTFGVDYLVTGDDDLLILADRSAPLEILTPAAFAAILGTV